MAGFRRTLFLDEFVTGGGLSGEPLPPSWAAEGSAMRRALAEDFSSVPGLRVVMALDARLPDEPGPWDVVRVAPGESESAFRRLARSADFTLSVAPETGGELERRTAWLREDGCRSLGSDVEAVQLAGDKLRLAEHWRARGLPTPPTVPIGPDEPLPRDFPYPAVLKPIDGAGSLDTFYLDGPDAAPERSGPMILQPYIAGVPMSASFLIDGRGAARLVGVTRQHIDIKDGRLTYLGGHVLGGYRAIRQVRLALEAIEGLRGWVGIDFIRDMATGRDTLIELNPRLTTSYVGLRRLHRPGVIARKWLSAIVESAPLRWLRPPGWLAPIVLFRADGTIRSYKEGLG